MRYQLIHSAIEQDGCRAIEIRDHEKNKYYVYYTQEIIYIKESGLKAFLFSHLKDINEGYYDVD
ncbi:hypothetical protein [Halobacillus hunanensis]|uniref:hypothetical protein n=1 Tax=Halobacillus hunanensis TaxID=578214 RepID=UPI0009A6D91F|nr:hypothetical protein [Halobacillus hunanensis]